MRSTVTILMVLAIVLGAGVSVRADVYVRGYVRSNGTYVQPHYRSNPDGIFENNWSTYPNVNPYTGTVGPRHMPSYSENYFESPSLRLPSYGWSRPELWNGRSPILPSIPMPQYGASGNSLWGK
jgi:hypothetical protein